MHCATSFMISKNKKHEQKQRTSKEQHMAYNNKRLSSSVQPDPSITNLIDIVSNNEPELEDCGRVEVRTKHQRSTCIPPSPKRRHSPLAA